MAVLLSLDGLEIYRPIQLYEIYLHQGSTHLKLSHQVVEFVEETKFNLWVICPHRTLNHLLRVVSQQIRKALGHEECLDCRNYVAGGTSISDSGQLARLVHVFLSLVQQVVLNQLPRAFQGLLVVNCTYYFIEIALNDARSQPTQLLQHLLATAARQERLL